ncbi:MAG: hypothetical protein IKP00_08840 [Victivallales bacterium]|nr:hypothetical protein [Victivallales bacterium]
MTKTDILILGATFYGCGIAARAKGKALVLDNNILAGWEFVHTLNPGKEYDEKTLCTEDAHKIYSRLREVNALSVDGHVSLAGLSEVFAEWCLARRLPIEFGVDLIRQDANKVVAVTPSGVKEFEAERIVDARPKAQSGKWLNAMITAPSVLPDGGKGPFVMRHSLVDGEAFLSFQVPDDSTWSEARAMFHRAWDLRPVALKYSTIMLTATRFDYRPFANPLAAFDAGLCEEVAR